MSRCICCNNILKDNELTRKYSSGHFTDTCNICWDLSGRSEGVIYDSDGNVSKYYKIPDEELKFGYAFGMDEYGENPVKTIAEEGYINIDDDFIYK